MLTVLLTDGAFTGLIRTLRAAYDKEIRIIGLSEDPYTPHQSMLDGFYVVPRFDHITYMPMLKEILVKEQVDIIFPIVSEGLEGLMACQEELKDQLGVRIISSPLSALSIANDKGNLYKSLKKDPHLAKIIPTYYEAATKKELFHGISALEKLDLPLCIKRRRGEDAAGFWQIDPAADTAYAVFYQRPSRRISPKALKRSLQDLTEEDPIPPYLVSEFLPGEEWDCDVLCYEGNTLSITSRINLEMTGGLTSLLEVKANPELEEYCRQIVAYLGLSYVACISFRQDIHGQFRLLEINPRMMGNIYVSCLAGNNYPQMSIDLLYGRPISPLPPKEGIRTALYYDQLLLP